MLGAVGRERIKHYLSVRNVRCLYECNHIFYEKYLEYMYVVTSTYHQQWRPCRTPGGWRMKDRDREVSP